MNQGMNRLEEARGPHRGDSTGVPAPQVGHPPAPVRASAFRIDPKGKGYLASLLRGGVSKPTLDTGPRPRMHSRYLPVSAIAGLVGVG